MTGVTGVISMEHLRLLTGQYLDRGCTAHLIDLAVRLENSVCNRQYQWGAEKCGEMRGVLGHATNPQGVMPIEGILVKMTFTIKLRSQILRTAPQTPSSGNTASITTAPFAEGMPL